jgi:hypothetical protein
MKNWIQLTAMETQDSSDPAGNLTTNFDPARSSWSLRGRNRQMTRIVSSRGISPPSTPSPGKSTEDIFISSGASDSGKTHDTTSLTKLHAKLWPGASKERRFNLFRESAKLQSLWYNFFEFIVSYWNLGGFFLFSILLEVSWVPPYALPLTLCCWRMPPPFPSFARSPPPFFASHFPWACIASVAHQSSQPSQH